VSGEELSKYDVAMYAASVDTAETNEKFAKELELDYPILSDPEKTAAKAFGVIEPGSDYASRVTFIIGKDGKILDVLRDVDPKIHGHEVADRLSALKVPHK
jgi:peroxiredoxin Q/BCP